MVQTRFSRETISYNKIAGETCLIVYLHESVAANPGEVTTLFDGITRMDQMTPTICSEANEHDTTQLIDDRDGVSRKYWVAKLKDGNCWMVQNLDYNDPNSTKVSAPSSWTSTSNTYRAYYDPGNYYLINPSSWTACDNNGTGLSACTSKGWSTTGDSHYHAGNYYSWAAATNNTGNSISTDGAIASGSICPGNWELPFSKEANNGIKGSFYNLLIQYRLTSTPTNGDKAIYNAPLYLIPGGYVNSGKLYSAGSSGYYWSSTANNSTNAYLLYFASSGVSPSDDWYRYFGLSVRCLVQGS